MIGPLRERGGYSLLAEKKWKNGMNFASRGIWALGYFRVIFFSRPEIITARKLNPPTQLNCLRLMASLNRAELDFDELTEIISRDVSLSYNLIKLVNSAAFAKRQAISSIKHALVYLGEREIRKWVVLIGLQRLSVTEPEAPIITSMVRARFLELLADWTEWRPYAGTLFLAGLFSLLDVLLQNR